jgi:uncharacterized protein with GYD domain
MILMESAEGPLGKQEAAGMSTYVILMSWTYRGVRADKDTVRRRDQADALAEKYAAKVAHLYWTMGQYDTVAVIDAPTTSRPRP